HDSNPVFLAYAIDRLLRNGQAVEAARWAARLAKVAPASWEAAALGARVQHARRNNTAAVNQLKGYARQKDARLDLAATLLDELGEAGEAEKMYRAHAATSKDPGSALPLARFLARRGQVDDALKLCEAAWPKCNPEVVALASLAVVE